jgi:hypothetical protein
MTSTASPRPARLLLAVAVALALLAAPTVAPAATNFYDTVPGTAPLDGGAGNWSASNWKATSNATSGGAWVDGNDAWFQALTPHTNNLGGGSYTVGTLFANATLGMIVLTNGTLTLNGIIASPGNSNVILNLASTSIGAGGVSNNNTGSTKLLYFGSNVNLAASQTWAQGSGGTATFSNGVVNLGANTLTLAAYGGVEVRGNLVGSGNVVATGPSMATLYGTNTYSGYTLVLGSLGLGTASLHAGGVISNMGQIVLSGSGNAAFIGSSIVGTGAVIVTSSGINVLTNANSYSGGTYLSQNGTLWASNASALGSGLVMASNNGTVNLGGFTHSLGNVTIMNGSLLNGTLSTPRLEFGAGAYSVNLVGTGSVAKIYGGVAVLSGSNAYSGPTTVSYGAVTNVSPYGLPFGSGSLFLTNSGTVALRPASGSGAITFYGGTNPGSVFAYAGGNTLVLATGATTGLTYLFGPGDAGAQVLTRVGRGTLAVLDDGGTSSITLGGSVRLSFSGQGPTNLNGMISPSVVRVAGVGSPYMPEFLSNSVANGLVAIGYDVTNTFAGADNTKRLLLMNVGSATSTNVVGDNASASAYATRIGGGTGGALVLMSNNAVLNLGNAVQGPEAGLIFSGGADSGIYQALGTTNATLNFGAAEGILWSGGRGGTIGVGLTGNNGATFASVGGATILMGATSTLTGPLSVNQGTLILSNAAWLGASSVSVQGTLSVKTGGVLNASSDLVLGPSGSLAPLGAGASINVAGQFINTSTNLGVITLAGGNLTVGSLYSTNGPGAVVLSYGTLTVSNGLRIYFANDPNLGNAPFQTLTLNVLGGASNLLSASGGGFHPGGSGNMGSNMTLALNFLGGSNYFSAPINSFLIPEGIGATGTVTVAGPGTLLVGQGRWQVGSGTNGFASVVVSNGATFLQPASSASPSRIGGVGVRGLVLVDNATISSPLASFYFGVGATNSVFMVTNGGRASVAGLYFSNPSSFVGGINASSNQIIVTGSGSVITNTAGTTIGGNTNATYNQLLVLDGGDYIQTAGSVAIGGGTNATGNSVVVAGGGSLLAAPQVTFGGATLPTSTNNSLWVTNGGVVQAGASGVSFDGVGNRALVSGPGSRLESAVALTFGSAASSAGNLLVVSDGGRLYTSGTSLLGNNKGAALGRVVITGDGSMWTNSGVRFEGQSNELHILGGALYQGADTYLGGSTASSMSSNNTIVVADRGVFTNSGLLSIGNFGNGNRFLVTNGGAVYVGGAVDVGNVSAAPTAGQTLTNNLLLVAGPTSRMTVLGDVTVGGRPLVTTYGVGYAVVSNGAQLVAGNVYVSPRAVNPNCAFDLSGAGTLVQASNFFVGRDTSVNTGVGGFARVADGAVLDVVSLQTGTANNFITNAGGVYQFFAVSPTITPNTPSSIVLGNGTVAFRDVANVNVKGNWGVGATGRQLTNLVFVGDNAFRLNNSSTTNAGQEYVFDTGRGATNYVGLEMVNGNTAWRSAWLAIGAGGSLLVSNTTADVYGVLTNSGSITVASASASYWSNVVLSSGSLYRALAGTNAFNGGLAINDGATMTMDAWSTLTGTVTNNSLLQILTNAVYAVTGGQAPAGNGALNVSWGGALTYSNGAYAGFGGGGVTNDGLVDVQNLAVVTLGGSAGTPSGSGVLRVSDGGALNFGPGSYAVGNTVSNLGTVMVSNALVTFHAPVVIGGLYVSDPSTNVFTTNVTVDASGALVGSNGDLFVFQDSLVMMSTNRSQYNLSLSAMLFTNAPAGATNHLLNLAGSGALDMGANWTVAEMSTNFSLGSLQLGLGNTLHLTGAVGNAFYVGRLDLGGLDTNSLAALLDLDVNLYYDPGALGNEYLNGLAYSFADWSGTLTPLGLPIPEPSPLLAVGAGLAALAFLRRRRA